MKRNSKIMDYSVYQASETIEKAYTKALDDHPSEKTIPIKDLETFCKEL